MKKVNEVKNKQKNLKQGFTLLELLVVIIIIGVLAAIALPQYRKAVAKAELAQLLSIDKAISNAERRYFLIYDTYTSSLDDLDVEYQSSNGIGCDVGAGRYVRCYNKNFFIAHYFASANIECYARNKNLAFACENLFNNNSTEYTGGPCTYIGGNPCYMVIGNMPI